VVGFSQSSTFAIEPDIRSVSGGLELHSSVCREIESPKPERINVSSILNLKAGYKIISYINYLVIMA